MADLLLACIVVIVLPARAWHRHRRQRPAARPARYIAETLVLTAALVLVLWRHGVPPEAIGLGRRGPWRFVGDLAFCVLVVVGLDAWSCWRETSRLRAVARDPRRRAEALAQPADMSADIQAAGRAPAAFAAVAIVGAVWEELCFRAVPFLLLPRTALGLLLAIVGGSLIFGAQHLRHGLVGMAYTFGFGMMFALLYLATGNLLAVIVAHTAGNVLAAVQWAPRIDRARRAAIQQPSIFLG